MSFSSREVGWKIILCSLLDLSALGPEEFYDMFCNA